MRFEPRNGQDSEGRWTAHFCGDADNLMNPDSWITHFNCFEITVACMWHAKYESLLQSALCDGKFQSTK